jgi:hypothetical protein
MGSFVEFNDSLVIGADQGFPVDVFDIKKQATNPVTLDDVKDKVFNFYGKVNPRFFQLDPVRVFFYQYLYNEQGEGKWLGWGQILIQSQIIAKNPGVAHAGANNVGDPKQWVTSGTFKMLKVFDPEYQRIFTQHETPAGTSYFGDN